MVLLNIEVLMIWMMGNIYILMTIHTIIIIIEMKYLIFSFDFGDDDIKPLAYDSEGKPLNCGELVTVNEDKNGNVNSYLLIIYKYFYNFQYNVKRCMFHYVLCIVIIN